MASLTIRNLDEDLKRQLRLKAAVNNRSMEEEARQILRSAVENASRRESLALRILNRFKELHPEIDAIEIPARKAARTPDHIFDK